MVLDTGGRGGLKIQIKSSDGLEIWPGFQRQSVNLPKLALWQLKLRELSEAIAQIYACRTYGRPSSFETHARKVIRPPKFMRGPSSPKRVPTIGRLGSPACAADHSAASSEVRGRLETRGHQVACVCRS